MHPRGPAQGVRPISSGLKTLAVLDILGRAERPLRLVDVAQAAGGSRATTYQKLVTLVAAGWAEQTEEGTYRLSLHAARMGEAALRQAGLGERATLVMQELVAEVGETVSLAVMSGMRVQIVKRVEAQVVVRVEHGPGAIFSLDESSSGRVLTAFLAPEYRDLLVKKGAVLASEAVLRDVRKKGYAFSTGRDVPGVRSAAVPVFDANGVCTAALSIVAPVPRFKGPDYVKPLLRAAERLRGLVAGG